MRPMGDDEFLGGPDEGHTFRFEVSSRMSSKVVGEEFHSDADYFGPPHIVHVRAWSLTEAIGKVAALPFGAWTLWGDEEDDEGDLPVRP